LGRCYHIRNEVKVAFQILEDGAHEPVNYQFMKCHVIFNVKMEDFWHKAQLVAGGHMTAPPQLPQPTMPGLYSGCESIICIITLTTAALKDLDLLATNLQNAYLNAPITEKIWTILGAEFGYDLKGRKAIIVRAIYGLKSTGATFQNQLAVCMAELDYKSCLADPHIWMRPQIRDEGLNSMSMS
jgi:hypothetical protein